MMSGGMLKFGGDVIKSATNAEVKQLRSLHERKYRRQTGWFLAEGMRHCTEAVQLGFVPQRLAFAANRDDIQSGLGDLIKACEGGGGRVLPLAHSLLGRISRKDNPQMVLAAFAMRYTDLEDIDCADDRDGKLNFWVALDRVRDPGNLGTIMRTAEAAGARGIILIDDCTDPYSVEAVRASMGAIFNIDIICMTAEDFADFAQKWSGRIIGTSLAASSDYQEISWHPPLILLMGNEQAGLPSVLSDLCSDLVRLPMRGRADSLNLAVATGICIYQILAGLSDDQRT